MNDSDYPAADTPDIQVADRIADALRSTAAVIALTDALKVSAADAVVVGMGDGPWGDKQFSIAQLEEIGCRIFIGPGEDGWIVTAESESGPPKPDESYVFDVSIRRQVLRAEEASLSKAVLHKWFWSHCAAMTGQLWESASSCVQLKRFEGVGSPAFNTKEERVGQGTVLHASFSILAGDQV